MQLWHDFAHRFALHPVFVVAVLCVKWGELCIRTATMNPTKMKRKKTKEERRKEKRRLSAAAANQRQKQRSSGTQNSLKTGKVAQGHSAGLHVPLLCRHKGAEWRYERLE